ncbi:MAG TPA: RdgB/HAM1 family non-canonical purine NTP pyrophosphatase [Pseudomonadales bacterium]
MNKTGFDQLVLASGNAGKLKEFAAIFAGHGIEVIPQSALAIDDAEETGLSFVENAIIKARHAARLSGLPALADDSGLAVDALAGQPGIYSARYSGADASDEQNNAKLLEALHGLPDAQRGACFHCVLVLMRHAEDPVPLIFHGQWRGRILQAATGDNGFGYDPLFFCPQLGKSSAQLPADVKNRVSHRGQAVTQLIRALND